MSILVFNPKDRDSTFLQNVGIRRKSTGSHKTKQQNCQPNFKFVFLYAKRFNRHSGNERAFPAAQRSLEFTCLL